MNYYVFIVIALIIALAIYLLTRKSKEGFSRRGGGRGMSRPRSINRNVFRGGNRWGGYPRGIYGWNYWHSNYPEFYSWFYDLYPDIVNDSPMSYEQIMDLLCVKGYNQACNYN